MTNGNDSIFIAKGVTLDGIGYINKQGLTKRELFAAMAMQGMLADASDNYLSERGYIYAEIAVKRADALIAELNKEVQS